MRGRTNSAFTLIELLIVVAIIAILAAIAVPNFLEAQTRSKISRCLADMRTLATGIEAYSVDYNACPPSGLPNNIPWPYARDGNGWIWSHTARLAPLTTPVSYLTSVPNDPFARFPEFQNFKEFAVYEYDEDYWIPWAQRVNISPIAPSEFPTPNAGYVVWGSGKADVSWRLYSVGPDNTHNFTDSTIVGLSVWQKQNMPYDATNGTVSHGDLYRYGSSDRGNKWQ